MKVLLRAAVLAGALAAAALVAAPASGSAHSGPHQAIRAATAVTPNGAWTVYHHDDAHTGYDGTRPNTTAVTPGWTSPTLDDSVYGEPLVYGGIVYVATLNNTVYAINQADGTVIWSNHLRVPETSGWTCGGFTQGILGTPVIDAVAGRIYVATLDGTDDIYRLEGLDLATGTEVLKTIINTSPATSFDWRIQQQRGALAIANGYIYVPFGGRNGDCGTYHGWIFAVPTNGGPVIHYYSTPGSGAGFWAAGGVVVDDSTGKVFDTSGNGTSSGCDNNPDGTPVYENDAVVRLSATLSHEDAFIPQDWQGNWCGNDQDLGSASMVLINPTLAFQAGKWGNGFLVNPQALGGMDGQLYPTPSPAAYNPVDVCLGNHQDANFGSYAYAAPYVYLSCNENSTTGFLGRMVALKVNTSTPSFSACGSSCVSPSWSAGATTFGPPIVAGGAVWAVDINGGGLYGFDAATGAQIYHSAGFSVNHFSTPSEAGGQIFVSADNVVMSFSMQAGCKSVSQSASPASPAVVGTQVNVTAVGAGCPNANPMYEFWTLAPGASLYTMARGYSANAVFSWATAGLVPGTYRINVWAKDANSAGVYGNSYGRWDTYNASLLVTLTGCQSVSEVAAPATAAMVSMQVSITATAVGCPNPQYEFWVLAPGASLYTLKQGYGTNRVFSWPTTGLTTGVYRINVWVRDTNSAGAHGNSYGTWDAYNAGLPYTLTAGCPSVSDSASPPSTAPAGTAVTITAGAPGCPNPTFEFWVLAPGAGLYTKGRVYDPSPAFGWSTIGLAKGTYRITVWVRDASSPGVSGNSYGTWDAYNANMLFTLT